MAIPERFIEGLTLVHCSCDYGCPCEGNAEPTHGYCEGVFGLRIDEGYFADVRLDGLLIAATYHFPRASHHGGGHLQPIRNPVTDDEHRMLTILLDAWMYDEHKNISGDAKGIGDIKFDLASRHASVSRFAYNNNGLAYSCEEHVAKYGLG